MRKYRLLSSDMRYGVIISETTLLKLLEITYKRNNSIFYEICSWIDKLGNEGFDVDSFISDYEKKKKTKRGLTR